MGWGLGLWPSPSLEPAFLEVDTMRRTSPSPLCLARRAGRLPASRSRGQATSRRVPPTAKPITAKDAEAP